MGDIVFKVVDGDYIDYDQAKQDYINGIRGDKLMNKHQMGRSQYKRLLTRFHEEGIPVTLRRTPILEKDHYNPTNVHRVLCKGITYWVVKKRIKGKVYYYGYFTSKAEAEKRAKELKENGWDGLL